tara:strand:- start:104 stop:286 length:183 start_codon:yes stop_codon:yes gene_type:complete
MSRRIRDIRPPKEGQKPSWNLSYYEKKLMEENKKREFNKKFNIGFVIIIVFIIVLYSIFT